MAKNILKAFEREVRRLRTERGISQEELAYLCGLHRTYIGSVERGERNLSLLNIVKISKALDLAISSLVGGLDGKNC